jgi:hypothetical protein
MQESYLYLNRRIVEKQKTEKQLTWLYSENNQKYLQNWHSWKIVKMAKVGKEKGNKVKNFKVDRRLGVRY